MSSSAVRTGILALLGAAGLVLLVLALLPAIASTQLVRDRIAQELSAWSGYQVTLVGRPHIEVWPGFKARLDDVRFGEWQKPGEPPVLTVDRIDIDLSAMAAIRGQVEFSTLRMERPVLRMPEGAPETVVPDGGRMMWAIDSARSAVRENSATPDLSHIPSFALGTIEIVEGRIVGRETDGSQRDIATALSGRIAWPALDRAMAGTVKGVWRGETISVEASAAQPLLLAGGGSAPLSIRIASEPLTASFEGSANVAGRYVDGTFSLKSPSIARALEWVRGELSPGASLGSLAIAGHASGGADRLKLSDATVAIGGNPGTGALELAFGEGVPTVSGTLAFDKIDLNALAAAFNRPADHASGMPADLDFDLAGQLGLDLRLSASEATSGDLTLMNVAATAQLRDRIAVLDISDAEAFGGSIQTGLKIDAAGRTPGQIEFRLLAEDIDGAAVSSKLEWARLAPRARGSVSVILRGQGVGWDSAFDRADGSITAKFGSGAIAGIDLPALLDRLGDNEFFAFSDVADGTLAIEAAELKTTISGGIARIETARVRTAEKVISLSGILPYPGRGLALSGAVSPQAPKTPALDGEDALFFVGGSWSAPFISPIMPAFPVE